MLSKLYTCTVVCKCLPYVLRLPAFRQAFTALLICFPLNKLIFCLLRAPRVSLGGLELGRYEDRELQPSSTCWTCKCVATSCLCRLRIKTRACLSSRLHSFSFSTCDFISSLFFGSSLSSEWCGWYTDMAGCSIRRSSIEWKVSKLGRLLPENVAAGVTIHDSSEHTESTSHPKHGLLPDEEPNNS